MDIIYFTDKWGRRRTGEYAKCEQCGTDFVRAIRKDKQQRYCTTTCKYLARGKKIDRCCAYCGKPFKIRASQVKNSRSGLSFCSRDCKDLAQRIDGGCPEIHPSHYGEVSTNHRQIVAERFVKGCVGCGDKRQYVLVVHHIDGNDKNNEKSNLEVVCGNCHIVRHLREVNGKWVYWTLALTPRDKIDELTRAGMY